MAQLEVSHIFPTPIFTFSDIEEIDNEKLELFCRNHKLKDSGKNNDIVSNVGGYQSNDMIPKYCDDESILKLIKTIEDKVFFCIRLLNLNTFKENLKLEVGNFWFNINNKGNYNYIHTHPKSFFSAVYYLKVPNGPSGTVEFIHPYDMISFWWDQYIDEYDSSQENVPFTAKSHRAYPKTGQLIIFPSWLKHGVSPNLTDEERISIAFNIITKQNDSI